MSIVRIIETDPRLHLSHETREQTPASIPAPLDKDEIRAAVERGHALRSQYIAGISRDFYRFAKAMIKRSRNRLRGDRYSTHGAR